MDETPTTSGSSGTAEQIDALRSLLDSLQADNQALRERLAELEARVDETHGVSDSTGPDGEDIGAGTTDDADGETPIILPSGGQSYKVRGKITEASGGIGVFGFNDAGSGTTYGVWGEVDSSNGYGLYTPDDAKVDQNLEVGSYLAFTEFGLAGTKQRTAGPIAKGYINADATIANAVNVSSVSWTGSLYKITLDHDDYWYDEYVTEVTSIAGDESVTWGISSSSPDLVISPSDDSQHAFMFVTHKLVSGQATTSSLQAGMDHESGGDATEESSQGATEDPSTR